MKSLSDNLYRRLTLSKYLFRQARRILQQLEPYSRGLATSLLHDSVEVLLGVLIEHYKIKVTQREGFLQQFSKVSKRVDCVGEHSAAIRRLNTSRVAFKHEGLHVSAIDAGAFLTNVEVFLSEVSKQEFGVDFATLSLVNAIGHRRTQNWLEKARETLQSEHYAESVSHSATAMAIYLHHRDNHTGGRIDPSYYVDSDSDELGRVVDMICDYFEPIRTRLDLVSHGVDVVAFDKFEALTPWSVIGQDGSVGPYRPKSSVVASREEARFCYDFAVDSILALRETQMPARIEQNNQTVRVRVKTPCALIVNPKSDPPEVIREVAVREELLLAPQLSRTIFPPERSEFVQVVQDGDVAYVRRDCLEGGIEDPQ